MALIKCQHHWLDWLEKDADFVRVFSFDFSKAFDSVSHQVLCNKLKSYNINPYITNWIMSFLSGRQQRVVVDGIVTRFLDINRGVPQGTVLGPILFSIMVNDIKSVKPKNLLTKYADDITLSVPVKSNASYVDSAHQEVANIKKWTEDNKMKLNLAKTFEMLIRGKTQKPHPECVEGIHRKNELKLLGVTFSENPCNWDTHFKYMLEKANSRIHILRVCKYYGYSLHELTLLFDSLIMSLFSYAMEVWACAYDTKYMSQIERFCKRAVRYGYTSNFSPIAELTSGKDRALWEKITTSTAHPLQDLLPPKKTRSLRRTSHNYILPRVRTERYKRCFINRCLFNFNK